jgi:hypothetical protein
MMREANFRLMAWAGLTLLAVAGVSQPVRAADEWPTRDITFYVPYAPGGSTDPISRKYAELWRSSSRSRSSSRTSPALPRPSAPAR